MKGTPAAAPAAAAGERPDYGALLRAVAGDVAPVIGSGRLPDFIPALTGADRRAFGLALETLDGESHGVGAWREAFSIQSITKLFALALIVARDGAAVWERVGREPSGDPFNSLVQLEHDRGFPRNPFVNAGALVVTDRLQTLTGDAAAAVRAFARRESGNPRVDWDREVSESERRHGKRNAAMGHLLAHFGRLENTVDVVLEHYVRMCALRMSCAELARSAGFLARHGRARDGARVFSRSEAKRINALLMMAGTYDAAGEVAYRVGLPVKSGVGGGIVAVIPNRCTLCAWSPGLDAAGNSVAGVAALDAFTTRTGWSVF